MNDQTALRIAARRASLYSAIRSADAVTAARAGARLRVTDAPLSRIDVARARDARRVLGRAIIRARLPQSSGGATAVASPLALPRRSRRRAWLALALLPLLLLLLLEGGGPNGLSGSPDEAVAVQPAAVQRTEARVVDISRGRTIALPPEIVVAASPSPTPEPSPTPTATPAPASAAPTVAVAAPPRTNTPAPTSAGAGGAGGGGSGASGGSGSGSGSGGAGSGGGGSGSGSGSGTGFRTPEPLPPSPPPGFGRFRIIVLDSFTARPIPGACVVIGTQSCDPSAPHTDANGQWAVDIPATTQTTYWDLYFSKPGYFFERRQLGLAAGRTVTFTILLRRTF